MEGQVLSSLGIRVVRTDRPTTLCMEGPRQRRALAQTVYPGGLGKKEREAAVTGDTWGEDQVTATRPGGEDGGRRLPPRARAPTAHQQASDAPGSCQLPGGDRRAGAVQGRGAPPPRGGRRAVLGRPCLKSPRSFQHRGHGIRAPSRHRAWDGGPLVYVTWDSGGGRSTVPHSRSAGSPEVTGLVNIGLKRTFQGPGPGSCSLARPGAHGCRPYLGRRLRACPGRPPREQSLGPGFESQF